MSVLCTWSVTDKHKEWVDKLKAAISSSGGETPREEPQSDEIPRILLEAFRRVSEIQGSLPPSLLSQSEKDVNQMVVAVALAYTEEFNFPVVSFSYLRDGRLVRLVGSLLSENSVTYFGSWGTQVLVTACGQSGEEHSRFYADTRDLYCYQAERVASNLIKQSDIDPVQALKIMRQLGLDIYRRRH